MNTYLVARIGEYRDTKNGECGMQRLVSAKSEYRGSQPFTARVARYACSRRAIDPSPLCPSALVIACEKMPVAVCVRLAMNSTHSSPRRSRRRFTVPAPCAGAGPFGMRKDQEHLYAALNASRIKTLQVYADAAKVQPLAPCKCMLCWRLRRVLCLWEMHRTIVI